MTTPRDDLLFPALSAEQVDGLRPYGEVRTTRPGDVLFQEGDQGYDFYVILEGTVDIVDRSEAEETVIVTHGAGKFLGELNMLTGQTVYLLGRVREGGAVLALPPARLREIVAEQPALSDLILNAFIARRARLLEGATSTLKIIGSRFSPETLRLREFAARNQLPHAWLDGALTLDANGFVVTGSALKQAGG